MVAYNRKLVMDYISGNDIVGYDIEKLEEDLDFMTLVIRYTKDKNMYHLCSPTLQKNYAFIKFLIQQFPKDLAFLCPIVDCYLEQTEEDFPYIELLAMMCNLTRGHDEYFVSYRMKALAFYTEMKGRIELFIEEEKGDSQFINKIGLGFLFIVDLFSDSQVTMSFFAERFMDDILTNRDSNLERIFHEDFATLKQLESTPLNNYLINYFYRYDSALAAYISCHLDLLDSLKEDIRKIKLHWDFFEASNQTRRYYILIEQVHEYMKEHERNCPFSELEILYRIGLELGVADEIRKYDDLEEEIYQRFISLGAFDKKSLDFLEWKQYSSIKKIMLGILTPRVVREPEESYSETSDGDDNSFKSKILKVDFKNQKLLSKDMN